jgi:uridine kinase
VSKNPEIIVIAGCNGSGKSTIAPHLLRDAFGLKDFVNALRLLKVCRHIRLNPYRLKPDD